MASSLGSYPRGRGFESRPCYQTMPKTSYRERLRPIIENDLSGEFNSRHVQSAAYKAEVDMPYGTQRATQVALKELDQEGYLTKVRPTTRKNTPTGKKVTLALYMKTAEFDAQK